MLPMAAWPVTILNAPPLVDQRIILHAGVSGYGAWMPYYRDGSVRLELTDGDEAVHKAMARSWTSITSTPRLAGTC